MGFNANQEENIAAYGGYSGGMGGFGGGSMMVVLVMVIVLWLLFRSDGHKDGYGGGYPHPGYGYGDGCGPCVQPTFKDESNYQEERNINSKLCCVEKEIWETDRDVWKTACETQQVEHCEAEKTRALIEANYVQDLRDRLAEKACEVQSLKTQAYTDAKFDMLNAKLCKNDNEIDKQFCKTDAMIAALACELPKRPQVFAECVTPNTHHVDCDRDFPRRRRSCDDECFAC